ncbi:MAG: hypothetical protein WC307_06845 [Candidatus Nanoarchaeia archaeon]|jgi:transposase
MSKVECYNCGYVGYPFEGITKAKTKKLKRGSWICDDCKKLGIDV